MPDPKLPTMDVYILPKHIWGKMSADERGKYDGLDGVGSGPFVLEKFEKGQFARFKANPYFWGGKPAVDKVVLRKFNNPDAMVAALKTGELDAAEDIPGAAFDQLAKDPNIQTVEGYQGSMTEVAINGGDGLKKPHPALLDPRVRQAIGHAIDKQTLVERVLDGHGNVGADAQHLAGHELDARHPRRPGLRLRPRQGEPDPRGRRLQGHGRRRRARDAGRRQAAQLHVHTSARTARPAPQIAEFVTGWLKEIGIATTKKVADDSQLTEIIGKGDYDMFSWGWTPVRGPGSDALVLHLRPGRERPQGPDELLQRRQLLRPGVRQALPAAEGRARPDKREQIVHEMLTRFQQSGVYNVIYTYPDLQAYVKGRFEGFVRQPAKIGPVRLLEHVADLRAAEAGHRVGRRRRRRGQRRDHRGDRRGRARRGRGRVLHAAPPHGLRTGVSARFIGAKVAGSLVTLLFVICFNFFLFRVVEGDPVANLYRGRNLSEQQRDKLTKQFGLDKSTGAQFVAYLKETATLNFGRSYTSNQPVWERDQAQGRADDRAGRASRRCSRRSSACCSASPPRGEDARAPTTR